MPHVRLVKEKYNYEKDVRNLIKYCFNQEKTANYLLIGFVPNIIQAEYPGREDRAAQMIVDNHRFYNLASGDMVHHLILSFSQEELSDPMNAWSIGMDIALMYGWQGYLCAFGVHTNTEYLHIHFVVDNTSFDTGKRFFIQDEVALVISHAETDLKLGNGKMMPQKGGNKIRSCRK